MQINQSMIKSYPFQRQLLSSTSSPYKPISCSQVDTWKLSNFYSRIMQTLATVQEMAARHCYVQFRFQSFAWSYTQSMAEIIRKQTRYITSFSGWTFEGCQSLASGSPRECERNFTVRRSRVRNADTTRCQHHQASIHPLLSWSTPHARKRMLFVPAIAARCWTPSVWPPATFVAHAAFSKFKNLFKLDLCSSLHTRHSVFFKKQIAICMCWGNRIKMIMHSQNRPSLSPEWRRRDGADASPPQSRHQHYVWLGKKFPSAICREYGVALQPVGHGLCPRKCPASNCWF